MEGIRIDIDFIKNLKKQPNVLKPDSKELRRMAEEQGTKTGFGNYNFTSTVRNRSAGLTVVIGSERVMQTKLNENQKRILKQAGGTVKQVMEYLKKARLICVERVMGNNPYFVPKCTLYVSLHKKDYVRLPYMFGQSLFEAEEYNGPEFYIIDIPEWQEKDRQILVFPEQRVTFVLGSDYYGEIKKGFLRMGMWHAKQLGMLGVHAGSKIIKAVDISGKIRKFSVILFGLTATGKTTHSCHDHGLTEEGEGVEIVQDDVVFIRPDGSALGTEKGFYIKTEKLEPKTQPLIYSAITKRDAILENIMVDYKGKVDFFDETLTGNGRGIIQRDDLGNFRSSSINLPPLSELDGLVILFITRRNTVVPIASRLTPEQAALAFMLGESVESTGGDPKKAGESVRVVGTNPFIIGDEAEEGNIFYNFVKKNSGKVRCYQINTGGVGEIMEKHKDGTKIIKQRVLRVEIPEMASIIRGIVKETIEWEKEKHFNVFVPKKIEGVEMGKFKLENFYTGEQIEFYVNELKRERIEYIKQFPNLNPAIIGALNT